MVVRRLLLRSRDSSRVCFSKVLAAIEEIELFEMLNSFKLVALSKMLAFKEVSLLLLKHKLNRVGFFENVIASRTVIELLVKHIVSTYLRFQKASFATDDILFWIRYKLLILLAALNVFEPIEVKLLLTASKVVRAGIPMNPSLLIEEF